MAFTCATLVLVALGLAAGRPAGAQQAVASIPVVAHEGRLLPFEQFQADRHPGCPADGGAPAAHLNTRSGGPAVALDLTEVPDPAPEGCGFGLLQQGAPGSALVRLANVDAGTLAAWSARTGIAVTGGEAVPPDGVQTPPPAPTLPGAAPVTPFPTERVALVLGLMIAAGVIAGYLVSLREARRPARASMQESILLVDDEPEDGGLLRERLARGHSGMLALPSDVPDPVPVSAASDRSEADGESAAPPQP